MSLKSVILIVEDSSLVRQTIARNLIDEDYSVVTAGSAREFEQKFSSACPDAVLLDLMLPDGDGFELLERIRERTDAPVIIISGKDKPVDKVRCLELGADDYVVKPLQMQEIVARVNAQIRRYKNHKNPDKLLTHTDKREKIRFGNWILDRKQFQAFSVEGKSAGLTSKEFFLLEALALSPDSVLTRAQILNRARIDDYDISDRAVDVQIMRIRKKLGDIADKPEIIRAARGIGYALACKTEKIA